VGVFAILVPSAAAAYVTRDPDLWHLGHRAPPAPAAPAPVLRFPLAAAAGGPEDLGLPEPAAAEAPGGGAVARRRAEARERLEEWLEEHGEEVLERRRREAIAPGELVVEAPGDEAERFYPLDDSTTPAGVALDFEAEATVRRAFRFRGTGAERDMSPRTIALLVEAAWFFQQPIRLVSGYRPRSHCSRRQSHHIFGEAVDLRMADVPMDVLADFFTVFSDGPYGPLGVGRYPRDGFVHVDTREETYFWTGNQPPRRRHRDRHGRR
jgi:hypothetical protein